MLFIVFQVFNIKTHNFGLNNLKLLPEQNFDLKVLNLKTFEEKLRTFSYIAQEYYIFRLTGASEKIEE